MNDPDLPKTEMYRMEWEIRALRARALGDYPAERMALDVLALLDQAKWERGQ